jgi:hypothetical protein
VILGRLWSGSGGVGGVGVAQVDYMIFIRPSSEWVYYVVALSVRRPSKFVQAITPDHNLGNNYLVVCDLRLLMLI